ncbi:BOS complex subunit NOMO1 [Anopheles ziemanni]|uniref:BOS complex subunit NOMO1 n=1 Tax=Anopheles coustani TaxID=139045 RepID=UPI00265A0CF9|nr:BOS complex subunit NOMO1 [Anopheles coustani]XP_058167839.1 BOS complex subunit NOMO1 [Anopheles ziemanni]
MRQPRSISFSAVLALCLLVLCENSSANEVFGCGGFVKNVNSDLDSSKVEVGLYTPQGSLKIKTECSPSNGYYFIPVYDKGDYVLKVIPPPGWSFEPEQVEIKFDGQSDVCSQGKDVNFLFKGFGITGRVEFHGTSPAEGAKGVRVELVAEDGGNTFGQTTTNGNGVFSFTPIKPGRYVVKVQHPKWHFVHPEYKVTVAKGNTEIPSGALVVSGYDVEGSVFSDGQPFGNVGLFLYEAKNQKSMVKCSNDKETIVLDAGNAAYSSKPLCFTTPNKNTGSYVFAGISKGKYLIRPHFSDSKIKFHIRPEVLELEVGNDGLRLRENFEVTGFSVSGRVLSAPGGPSVANAQVKLNGREIALTGSDGTYTLDNIQAGTYTIQVTAEDFQFKDHIVKVSFANPSLPDVVSSAFKVCGHVVTKSSYTVVINRKGSTMMVEVPSHGRTNEWCTFLENGEYTVQVQTTERDRASGLQYFPATQNIEVNYEPLKGIVFSQLRATVTGAVRCLADASSCEDLPVTLQALDVNGNTVGLPVTAQVVRGSGSYKFESVLPGSYEVSVPSGKLCWQSNTVKINIKSTQETVPDFVQTGYIVSVLSSHGASMAYRWKGSSPAGGEAKEEEIVLTAGMNMFCVKRAGEYTMRLSGCHRFDEATPSQFSTDSSDPIAVNAKSHRNVVRLIADEKERFHVQVLRDGGATSNEVVEFELTGERDSAGESGYVYRKEFFLEHGERITLRPQSEVMLFNPTQLEVMGGNDCTEVGSKLRATKGLLINGRTNPPVKDATITLVFPKHMEHAPLVALTDEQGTFRFGPIDPTLPVELSAEKESYVFSAYDRATSSFNGHKLCEIIVTVKDDAGNRLPGVLLSLSGAESYRKNLVTGEDGTIKFHSLSPSEYYLRAMMKEYEFRPNSKLIEVREGATVMEELVGTRTQFSIFGSITSLNGEPFPNVAVEAMTDEKCGNALEEATSEFNGQYRIRGLTPGCQYRVSVRTGTGPSATVDRSIPRQRDVTIGKTDTRDVNLIAISPLAFVDVTVRVVASELDHYKTLKVALYKKGSDSPVHSQRIESPLNPKSKVNPGIMVFFPRIPFDGKNYHIELTSTLSEKSYRYSLSAVPFVANTSSFYAELQFTPELRTTEGDLNQSSLSAIVLIAIIGFVFFKQELAFELLGLLWAKVGTVAGGLISSNKATGKDLKNDAGYIDTRDIDALASNIDGVKKKKTKKVS